MNVEIANKLGYDLRLGGDKGSAIDVNNFLDKKIFWIKITCFSIFLTSVTTINNYSCLFVVYGLQKI